MLVVRLHEDIGNLEVRFLEAKSVEKRRFRVTINILALYKG